MYEDKTYEILLESALGRVTNAIDKREGSLVMNGVAPSMAELAQLYIGIDFVLNATFLMTAPREFLIKRAADRNMAPKEATTAIHRAEFNIEVEAGTRFSCEDLNFVVTERMSTEYDTETGLSHMVQCETPGVVSNGYSGALIPIEYVNGLTHAELKEVLIPGEDEEDTEVFRARVLNSMRSKAFGGNQADYIEKAMEIDGVGAVKVIPTWNDNISPASLIPATAVQSWITTTLASTSTPAAVKTWLTAIRDAAVAHKLTVGGTVKLIIMGANNTLPSSTLVSAVQTAFDPVQNAGEGVGLAPIGHVVLVSGVAAQTVNISTSLAFATGWTFANAKAQIEEAIDNYFASLIANWSTASGLTVRISQLESYILLHCSAVIEDITDTKLNGQAKNLTVPVTHIPQRGALTNE